MNAKCSVRWLTGITFLLALPGTLLAQHIDDFYPQFAQVGENVDLFGSGFNTDPNQIQVRFNGVVAIDVYVASATVIHVTVPAGASTGYITVQNAGGPLVYSPQVFAVIGPGPYISDFSPSHGGAGTSVLINGAHFTDVFAVKFNGAPAAFFVNSDTVLQAQVPNGVTSGPITVFGPAGSCASGMFFYGAPVITGFLPVAGTVGAQVTIAGQNFADATALQFNGVPARSFTVNSNTQITALVPTNATSGKLTVVTPGGLYVSSAAFKVLPALYGFAPNFGAVGTPVTIFGANLNAGTPVVRFNGVPAATPTGVSYSQLTAVVPAGATTGPISVTTADGSATNAAVFYLPVSITGLNPNSGLPGQRVTLTGLNFNGATEVDFNGQSAQFTIVNNTTLTAQIPNNVTTGPLKVITPAYSAVSGQLFYGPPLIAAFSPTHGMTGTNVTITGSNLLVTTAVRFQNLSANFTALDNSQLVATVPANAVSGPISVETPSGTNTTLTNFTIDRLVNLAVWGSAAPTPATLGSNLTYTITLVNNGLYDAQNVRLTNTVDPSVALQSASVSLGNLTTNSDGALVSIPTLARGGLATLLLTARPQSLGFITNSMTVVSDNIEVAPLDNQARIVTLVQSPALLAIRLLATNLVRVSWPADLTNYVLESKRLLSTNSSGQNGSWSNVTTAPVLSGGRLAVTETNLELQNNFRLRR